MLAAKNYNEIKTLLNNNHDINLKDNFGNTALHYAVIRNNENLVKDLISLGANPRIKNYLGETPIFYAKKGPVFHALFNKFGPVLLTDFNKNNKNVVAGSGPSIKKFLVM